MSSNEITQNRLYVVAEIREKQTESNHSRINKMVQGYLAIRRWREDPVSSKILNGTWREGLRKTLKKE